MSGKINEFMFSQEELIEQSIDKANSFYNDNKQFFYYILIYDIDRIKDFVKYCESKNIGVHIPEKLNKIRKGNYGRDCYSKAKYMIDVTEFEFIKKITKDVHYTKRIEKFMYNLVYKFYDNDYVNVIYIAFESNIMVKKHDFMHKWYIETKEKSCMEN